ncbi:hypothetical protein TR51_25450 [Kitasatospora griseola]|uniref:Uncharacterized protein n=1 Tax=Kitasatospora griseola TaxID=2064 RepID=A0A0D0NTB0_KITGR|nr:hypothetical protein [Kitasatospora griseola]KIQ62396.1 hypothetical protein TR51_25450 [Kitasatospora griseola]
MKRYSADDFRRLWEAFDPEDVPDALDLLVLRSTDGPSPEEKDYESAARLLNELLDALDK